MIPFFLLNTVICTTRMLTCEKVVSITKKNNGKIRHLQLRWYRKPSNTLLFNQWNSHKPKIYQINKDYDK